MLKKEWSAAETQKKTPDTPASGVCLPRIKENTAGCDCYCPPVTGA
jgi:hypothetical protein